MSTGSSPSGFDESFPERDLILPDDMREELAAPIGDVVSEENLGQRLAGSRRIVSVGDVVTVTLLDLGIEPDVAVFDYRTQRSVDSDSKEKLKEMPGELVMVRNPPGVITKELWHAVREAVHSEERKRIEVSGEEDLASLVAIATAPEGSHVVYGLPGIGMTVVPVDRVTRAYASDAIRRMRR